MELAIAHQDEMNRMLVKIHANAGCIRQLLVGRTVRRRSDRVEFHLTESRLGLSGSITLYGKRLPAKPRARAAIIGGVRDIEIVEPTP